MISGSAALRASAAFAASPVASASSTLRTKVRMRLRRARLMSVRLAILRVIFLADRVLAMRLVLVSNAVRRAGDEVSTVGGGNGRSYGRADGRAGARLA